MVQPGVSALGKKNRTTFLPRKSFSETFLPFSSGKEKSGALSLISMRASPFRSLLYLTAGSVVMMAGLALIFGQTVPPQSTRREAARKGPRALGLLELAANGNVRLIPITVMFDGRFYDGGSYKASPIPMALERDTVYEAVRTGVSQGLFTVGGAFHRGNAWIADGKWEPVGAAPPKKRPVEASAPRDDDQDKPPVLRRPGSGAGSEPPKPTPPVSPPADTPAATAPAPSPAAAPAATEQNGQDNDNDKDRPVLRRGKQSSPSAKKEPNNTTAMSSPARAGTPNLPAANTGQQKIGGEKPGLQMMPAISDAGVSDPRPYTYVVKPVEEQQLRKKMVALATNEIRARARQQTSEDAKPSPVHASSQKDKTPAVRSAPPSFEDTQFRIFDLSNANEPVLVLTTKASFPAKSSSGADLYYVALVAREDISGELHKAFSNVTDSRHLDIQPRLELIDAVDADGDGRGELLFRQISDKGSAFVIYRVIGEQLWALFQGTPE
jgi:hypothetical protein